MIKTLKHMKISELITQEGLRFDENFSLEKNGLYEKYKRVYLVFLNCFNSKKRKSKGVLLAGGIGTGKTMLMRVFQRLLLSTERSFKWANAYELKDIIETSGTAEVKRLYGRELKSDLYLDDIGVIAAEFMKYGNTTNILAELILERYDLFISEGYKTHLSTNLPPASSDPKVPTVKKILTARAIDRVREMCEIITFEGQSLRN